MHIGNVHGMPLTCVNRAKLVFVVPLLHTDPITGRSWEFTLESQKDFRGRKFQEFLQVLTTKFMNQPSPSFTTNEEPLRALPVSSVQLPCIPLLQVKLILK